MKMSSSAPWKSFTTFLHDEQLHGFAIPRIRSEIVGAKQHLGQRNMYQRFWRRCVIMPWTSNPSKEALSLREVCQRFDVGSPSPPGTYPFPPPAVQEAKCFLSLRPGFFCLGCVVPATPERVGLEEDHRQITGLRSTSTHSHLGARRAIGRRGAKKR